MRFHRRDEYYASTDDGRFIICRVLVRDREVFKAWKEAVKLCEKASSST